MKTIRFIDLFAGIAGFRYGLERAGNQSADAESEQAESDQALPLRIRETLQEVSRSGWRERNPNEVERNLLPSYSGGLRTIYKCVWSNEWDKYANSIYKKHYGECDSRDIKTINSSEIPDFDLLVGGFPCQAFSIAGKRKGFDDTRGTLFFEIARILADKRPRYFILENVKGLLSHDEGKTFQTILGVCSDLGYDYQWQVLNSKNFGVPQNRERVFIVGHLRGTPRPKVFPIGEGGSQLINQAEQRNANTIQGEKDKRRGTYIWDDYNKKIKRESPTLTEPHHNAIRVFETNGQSLQEGGNKSDNYNTIRRATLANDMRIRRLTPLECERLQGFPDGWTEGVSDTQRYKCLGNAVTTTVITEIAKRLDKYIV